MVDESLEGTEAEKNAFLAPAEKVQRDEGALSTPPPIEKQTPPENKTKESVKSSDPVRRPTQDEIYYGDDFDDGLDVTRLLMAAYMSAEQERTIKLPNNEIETFIPAVAKGEWNPKG